MKKTRWIVIAAMLAMTQLAGCGSKSGDETSSKTESAKESQASKEDQVASSDDMIEPQEVVEEGMEPVKADKLKDGTYAVTVDSSSSMFHITACELKVANGKMKAVMTMSGNGYLQVYMGTGKEAVEASKKDYIPFVEKETGEHTFTVPVEALDQGINCTAFSKNKKKWYDRVLVFRADSLPAEAWKEDAFATVESLALEDGTYTAEVTMSGGSGRASIESPAQIVVRDGQAFATIIWSSSNYDYMRVGEQKYEPVNTEGNSTFEIPVSAFDKTISVSADTTAMSTPHEIDYTLKFSSKTLEKVE